MSLTPTVTAAQASESVQDSDLGSGINHITESTEKLTPADNLLEFGLGPS